MSKITTIKYRDASDEERAAILSYQRIVRQAASEHGFDIGADIGICEYNDRDDRVAIASLALPQFTLRLSINPRKMRPRTRKEIGELLRLRIAEAVRQQQKFTCRLDQVRAGVDAALGRAGGGMSIHSLGMDDLLITEPFDWYEQRLELKLNTLDHALRPELVDLHEWTARKFAGVIRWLGAKQRQRAARRDRLAANGAVLEIDTIAERILAAHGLKLTDVAEHLLTGTGHMELEGDERMGLSLRNGRLEAWGYLSRGELPAFLHGATVRIDAPLTEERRKQLAGRALDELVPHPAIAGILITSAKDRERRITDLTLRVRRRFVTREELQAA